MPELPDLQVFSHNLHKRLAGKKVKKLNVRLATKLKASVSTVKNALEDQELTAIYRDGKELHMAFKNGNVMGLHLMLHGDLHLFNGKNENKNTIIEFLFDDDTGLALTDWQGIATPTLNPEKRDAPDALSKEATVDFLKKQLNKRRTSVKNVLLDQHIIRGIGNAYADEILWDAGISPFSQSNKIPDAKIEALARSIKKVLHNAEKQIIKSNPHIISGELRDFLQIHHSKKVKSPTGGTIQSKVTGSRKTYFTDEQELFK